MSNLFIPTTNVLIKKDNKFLMLERKKAGAEFKDYIMAPGGKQEVEESIKETAAREMLEETGIEIKDLKLKIIGTHNHPYKKKTYLVYIFTASYHNGKIIECDEGNLKWFSPEELLNHKKLWEDLKFYLPYIIQGDTKILISYLEYNEKFEITKKQLSWC
jgi:8-oxo-dGTP diphosphatase